VKILKEGGIYTASALLEKSIPFLLMPFLTRVLSTEQYGIIAIFISTVTVYSLFVGAGLNGFVRVVYHKTSIKKFRIYVANSLALLCIMTLIAFSITLLFEIKISEIIKINSNYLYLALFVAFMKFFIEMRLIIFQTMRQAFNYAKLQLTLPIIELLIVILLVFYLHKGAEGRIFSITLSSLIVCFFSCYLLYKSRLLNIFFNLIYIKRITKFIFPILPHSIALTVFTTFDKFILSSNISLRIVGEISVALTLALPMWMLAESINKAFMPWSFEKFTKGRLEEVVGASYLLLFGLFVIGILYSIFLFFTFEIIIDEKFKDVLQPALILLWVGWLKLAYYLCAKGLVYSEKMNLLPLISISSGCVYFGLIFMNIENITLVSLSLYMNILYLLMFVGALILSQIIYPQPWRNLKSIFEVLKIIYKKLGVKNER
jgi:O-antigen/teichoic acid export membrane protein